MTATTPPAPPRWADRETINIVRPEVRRILESSRAFSRLSDEEKREIANNMVKVAAYMSDPDGLARQELTAPDGGILQKPGVARAAGLRRPPVRPFVGEKQAGAIQDTGTRFAGADFKAGAAEAGVRAFQSLVGAVDFPKFVGGLIKNVFQAIVDSSIQQMRAYGELLAAVAKSVGDYANDHISEANAKDWLSQKYPDKLGVQVEPTSSGFAEGSPPPPPQTTLVLQDGVDGEAVAKQITADLQLAEPLTDITDPDEQQRMILAARLQIAKSRQQLLASMVMLGINRIVVTDGTINAKVVFDMRAHDTGHREAVASQYDYQRQKSQQSFSASYGGWLSPIDAEYSSTSSQDHMATVSSTVSNTSTSDLEVKAKLTGEVRVNFKSDYFPMEKMANPQMIAAIQGNATPLNTGTYAGAGAAKAAA